MLLAHSTNKIIIKSNLIYVDTKKVSSFILDTQRYWISYVSAQVSINSNWSSLRPSRDPHRTEPRYSGNIFSRHVKIFSNCRCVQELLVRVLEWVAFIFANYFFYPVEWGLLASPHRHHQLYITLYKYQKYYIKNK